MLALFRTSKHFFCPHLLLTRRVCYTFC